jgi:hypothetical protein
MGNALPKKADEATLTLGGSMGDAGTGDPGTVQRFSRLGYSLVGTAGALDCVEGIGVCPKDACLLAGRRWGDCQPVGCDKAGIGFKNCRMVKRKKASCTLCSS